MLRRMGHFSPNGRDFRVTEVTGRHYHLTSLAPSSGTLARDRGDVDRFPYLRNSSPLASLAISVERKRWTPSTNPVEAYLPSCCVG